MTENIFEPPKANLELPESSNQGGFYVVSTRKFAILFLATMGIYQLYWYFRNWSLYKQRSGENIWPAPRALFAFIFVHALFRKINERLVEVDPDARWDYRKRATVIVLFLVISKILDRLVMQSVGAPFTDVISLFLILPMCLAYVEPQRNINLASGDPSGQSNDRLTGANITWIVIGVVFWALALIGMIAG